MGESESEAQEVADLQELLDGLKAMVPPVERVAAVGIRVANTALVRQASQRLLYLRAVEAEGLALHLWGLLGSHSRLGYGEVDWRPEDRDRVRLLLSLLEEPFDEETLDGLVGPRP